MKYYAATDLLHQNFQKAPPPPSKEEIQAAGDPTEPLFERLNHHLQGLQQEDGANQEGNPPLRKRIYRQFIPRIKYPANWSKEDCKDFETYWANDIKTLSVVPDKHPDSSPTLLTISQKIYDAEATRRESLNTRSTAVLSTAGVLGTLVVAAGQLGLIHQGGSRQPVAWIVYAFFVISLGYLLNSIITALRVHSGIQGEVIDARDLHDIDPRHPLDIYNRDAAKSNLLYGTFNWCLNNRFKILLQSAQVCLRNGLIAIIIAGALSPWLLTK
jgi:hypothetical protein